MKTENFASFRKFIIKEATIPNDLNSPPFIESFMKPTSSFHPSKGSHPSVEAERSMQMVFLWLLNSKKINNHAQN